MSQERDTLLFVITKADGAIQSHAYHFFAQTTMSLAALLYGDAETVSCGTRQHQSASSKASSRYSHSVIESCISMASRLHGVASSPR